MTVPREHGEPTSGLGVEKHLEAPGASVSGLLSSLEGIEAEPLAVQVERLEAVRKGLDDSLARPASGHG